MSCSGGRVGSGAGRVGPLAIGFVESTSACTWPSTIVVTTVTLAGLEGSTSGRLTSSRQSLMNAASFLSVDASTLCSTSAPCCWPSAAARASSKGSEPMVTCSHAR